MSLTAPTLPVSQPVRIADIQAYAYLVPVEKPVRTSFGAMHARPAVFVRVQDELGNAGWGEIWCNFPDGGARYKAHLVGRVFAAFLKDIEFSDPADVFTELTRLTEVLAIQCGEPGPIAHCIAGIDIALWDLVAQRHEQPLWRLLGGRSPDVPVYASGINPDRPELVCRVLQARGFRAFKLKVGFGDELDLRNLRAMRDEVGSQSVLLADANQGWDVATAQRMMERMREFELGWIEEPLRADRPWDEWRTLLHAGIPIAAGENLAGIGQFSAALQAGVLGVVQPDLAKWGGFSACRHVARQIVDAGKRYCPHFLGGGIGLLASAHLLAATGGTGMLEIDSNPNPLRSLTCGPLEQIHDGRVRLDDAPGLGFVPDLAPLRAYEVRL